MTYTKEFEEAFKELIKDEGGYVNDPDDAGGETNYGISKASYPEYDIKHLTLDQVKDIYYRDYWKKIQADLIPFNIAHPLFSASVNCGISKAVKILQRALNQEYGGHLVEDGIIGQNTRLMITASNMDEQKFVKHWLLYYVKVSKIRNNSKFLWMWVKRAVDFI